MKKNTMAAAIVAGIAGVAGIANISTAVNLNPDGVGQVLLYPYYTVNGGNTTVLSVVNTTDAGKAVKVRFRDARNSRDVRDFNVYLSAYDVWTAAVFSLSDSGPANITTSDTTCTVPGLESGLFVLPTLADGRRYMPFATTFFNDYTAAGLNTASPTRTREGYIEMIEMGVIDPDSPNGFGFFLEHINNRPADCTFLEAAWLSSGTIAGSGLWVRTNNLDIDPPEGGLFGGAAIVDVADGTYINYNAEAIDGFSVQPIHSNPAGSAPDLSSASSTTAGQVTSYVFDRGRLITSNWALSQSRGVDAVSAVLMREAIFNEYEVDPDLGAGSEWVVTFPTRHLYVSGPANSNARAPFTKGWNAGLTGDCERVSFRIYNREEDEFRIVSPSPSTGATTVCWEANPLWFVRTAPAANASTPILGAPGLTGSLASLWTGVPTFQTVFGITQKTFNNGWMWAGFYDLEAIGVGGLPEPIARPTLTETANPAGTLADSYFGLPAVGFWALRVVNVNQGAGLQASYGGAYPHRSARACFKANTRNTANPITCD